MDAPTITVVKDGGFFGHPQSDMGECRLNRLLKYQLDFSRVGKEWGSPNLTYFLLHHNIDGDEVRAELSLPVRIEDGFITEWEERIILKMPKSEPAVEEVTPPGDEISINVREKEAV